MLDPQGRLVLCQHGDRRVARREGDTFITLADRYQGKRFNSPNDAIYTSNGDLYFTDPPYGLPGLNNDPAKELEFNGVYRLGRDGNVTLLTREMTFPNGLALVARREDALRRQLRPEEGDLDGLPRERGRHARQGARLLRRDAVGQARKKGLPDGMKVDRAGNLFATGPGGMLVFDPDGSHLGTLNTGEATANCGWGDDGSTSTSPPTCTSAASA